MSIVHAQSNIRKLFIAAIGFTCTAVFSIGLTIWWLRADAIKDASEDTDKLAIVLAEQTTHSIRSIHLVLNEIKERLEPLGVRVPNDFDRVLRDEGTHQFLIERLSRLPQAEFIRLVDKNGMLVNTTDEWPWSALDVSHTAHFQHFKNNNDQNININDLQVDPIKGAPVVFFSLRINGANDTFLGMVVVGVKVTYFQNIYESIAKLHDQVFVLLDRDGTVIVRYPDSTVRTGEKIPAASPWYRLILQGGGTYRPPGTFDGKTRLMAVRPLRDYPLVINVGITETAALATWRNQATILGIGALLVMFVSAFLLKALSKQFYRLISYEASLAEGKAALAKKAHELEGANAQLAIAQAQTDAALNNISQGVVMIDSSARVIVHNRRYLEIYGLSPELVRPGCTLRDVLDQRVATGSFCAIEVEQFMADVLAAVGKGVVFSKLLSLPDGRIIRLVNHPMQGGGWVATHEDITAEKRADERIAYEANVDALTGLPNRKVFCEQLEQELKRVQRGERLAVLYLDLDYLKQVNDTLGHAAGDKLLKDVADRLRGCIRDIDVVARLSGDEFAIIQKLLDQPSDASALAMRIREAIHEPFDLDGHQITVDISVGISIAPNDAHELSDLMKTADIALYEAKNIRRGTYCFYEPEMNARIQARNKLEQDLQSALANGEFELFYQPIVSLEDNKVSSFEALLRWHHPERGLVSPAEFIPVAEDTGLIIPLGEWVLRTACAEAATWPNDIRVAVNVSSVQLTNKNLANAVVGAIASAGIQPNRLELEITESVFIQNTLANIATLTSLHDLGVRFAMDDFGTGYSSLSYLLSFPFHKIKIDRCFIAALSDKNESHAIVRAIADLARSLKLRVTAEGVETEQQLQQIRLLGCTEMQGYLLSPPRPAAELLQFFKPRAESGDNLIAVNASAGRKNGTMCGIRPNLVCSQRLTGRECDVLMGIMAGDSCKESARHLNISPRTIELHRGRIKQKFDIKNSADLVRVMLTKGCTPSQPRFAHRHSQPPEIEVAVTPLGGSIKEPESDPGDQLRARAIK
jgi:diguanylate cyclase (GGDEF)-like protein